MLHLNKMTGYITAYLILDIYMRFILRILGSWALGIALVLIVKDIVISLSLMSISLSSFAQTWHDLHATSWSLIIDYFIDLQAIVGIKKIFSFIINLPAWLILGFLGTILSLAGANRPLRR